MTRFLALIVNEGCEAARIITHAKRISGFSVAFQSSRITVLSDGVAPVLIEGQGGVVLGHLFKGVHAPETVRVIDLAAGKKIEYTRGKSLIEEFWGGYIGFIDSPDARKVSIIRDPSGEVTCYYRQTSQGLLVFSDLSAMMASGIERPPIDWDELGRHLRRMSYPTGGSALTGVRELVAGKRLDVTSGAIRIDNVWTPWDYVGCSNGNYDDLPHQLREVVSNCVRAWSEPFSHINLSLSGGLDSSVIAAALADRRDSVSAINLVSRSPAGDERRYARLVTDLIGIPLTEAYLDTCNVDIDRAASVMNPLPIGRCIGQAADAEFVSAMSGVSSGAVFNGEGGDNVFCFLHSPIPAIDRMLRHGIGRPTLKTFFETSEMSSSSLPRAALWSLNRTVFRRRQSVWPRQTDLLSSRIALIAESEPLPYWLDAPKNALPGKRVHVAALLRGQSRSRTLPGGEPVISPLLSQPIMELCLSIPTWVWCEGGIDRAPIRKAFASQLPRDVIDRTSKGGPDAFCLEVLASNRESLRDRLVHGQLARHSIIDIEAVDQALSPAGVRRGTHYLRLLELAEAEAWANEWNG